MRVLGVDGCKDGWVGVVLNDGSFAAAYLAPALADLIGKAGPVAVTGVDMPLGLVERGWRTADLAAAAFIGPRRASIFRIPPRGVMAEPDFAAANERAHELFGAGVSRQAWGLRTKVAEANAWWNEHPDALYEVHPEVSFRAMGDAHVPYPKTSWAGQALRRKLLHDHGIVIPDELGAAGRAGPDDILDAAAVAWSARRIADGRAASLPDPPQNDVSGRPIAIWY